MALPEIEMHRGRSYKHFKDKSSRNDKNNRNKKSD